MKISDQQLSAFIDNELSASEAEAVRSAIAEDESLCDRLAALSIVDHYVKQAAEEATRQPMPERITALFEAPAEQSSNVVAFPAGARRHRVFSGLALAASVALIALIGVKVAPVGETNANDQWAAVSDVLDTKISGQVYQADDQIVRPQLAFYNQQDQLCRQLERQIAGTREALIACKTNDQWQIKAKQVIGADLIDSGEYQTASAGKLLTTQLDQMIKGTPLNRKQEQQAIENQWLNNATQGVDND
ncbi:hypothetical protein EXU34_19065 [Alteromonas sp. ZYF713]|nr:hypothetical protein [Alteromonas sp. ZYF713]